MLKACIFDLDGVVVDTAKYHYIAWKGMANELGLDLSEAENENLKGISRMETLSIILSKGDFNFTEEEKIALATKKNEQYLDFVKTMPKDEVLPGIVNTLEALKANGIKIALGSASKNAVAILKQVELSHYFEVIIDGTKTTRSKPDPQTFTMGATALGVLPSETIVFEDSYKGVQAAISGGFTAVGIGKVSALNHAHEVVPGFADMTVEKLYEIHKKHNK